MFTRMINRDYCMAIFISYPISTQDTHISPWAEGQIRVEGWYGVWYENCHIIIYLSYIFLSDKFAYSISYAESKARPPSAPNVVIRFFARAKKLYQPCDPIITSFALHKWYVFENQSITNAKWTYFLVNVYIRSKGDRIFIINTVVLEKLWRINNIYQDEKETPGT